MGQGKRFFFGFIVMTILLSGLFLFLDSKPANALTDGVPFLVKDINTKFTDGPWSSSPYNFVNIGGSTLFVADDGLHGRELWKTNGTEGGTSLVKDINSQFENPGDPTYDSSIDNLISLNGIAYFEASDGSVDGSGSGLWRSDGTADGTYLVKAIDGFSDLTAVGDSLYFYSYGTKDGRGYVNSYSVWESDGTADGTAVVKNIYPGFTSETVLYMIPPKNFTAVGDTLYFSAYQGVFDGEKWISNSLDPGYELWKSDGTEAGTQMVKDINLYSGMNLTLGNFTNFDGTLFFTVSTEEYGDELWKSDGTEAGTVIVKDIFPNPDGWSDDSFSSSPGRLTVVGDNLFFSATYSLGLDGDGYPISTYGLWKTDGTEDGTVLVKEVYPNDLKNINGVIFFTTQDDVYGEELWKSDGTEAGTVMVKDIRPNPDGWVEGNEPYSSEPNNLTNVNGILYFQARTTNEGYELWKSDGTESGTRMVMDIYPNPDGWVEGADEARSSSPRGFSVIGDIMYFSADDGSHGEELWAMNTTESSPGGTLPIFVSLPGSSSVINVIEGQIITTNPYTIKVKPTDADGIKKVEFYIDNVLICTATTADSDGVYSCDWDTSKYHSDIKVLAYDTEGNVSTALTRSATVSLTGVPNTGLRPASYLPAGLVVIAGIGLMIIARRRYS